MRSNVSDTIITPRAPSSQSCRDARNLLRLTQEELAASADISVSTLRRFERDENVSDYAYKRIVDALANQDITFITGSPQTSK